MGLEERDGRLCYYRKERRGTRVRSVYVCTGETARLLSLLDASRAQEEKLKQELTKMERKQFEAHDSAVEHACSMIETLTSAALLAAGLHTHKRQWRRRR
jgi:hypothetical protein